MKSYKPKWASKTFWGALFGILSSFQVVVYGTPIDPGVMDSTVAGIVALISGVIAMYGRFKATQPIK